MPHTKQTLNISITPILPALGVGGLAVAPALQDTLSNLFSGLQVIASRQVKPPEKEMAVLAQVRVGCQSDLKKVEQVTIDMRLPGKQPWRFGKL